MQISILCPLDRSPQMPRGLLCRHYGYVHVPKRKTPHLLGPGRVWRKCYIVHPRTQALDPLMKYQWLTHTAIVHGLPERVTAPSLTDNCNITQCVERAREVLVCQLRDELTQAELSAGFLQSTLAGMWMQACGQQHLINSSLTFEPHVESYWRRGGDNFLCISKPMYILHTYRPLDLFCDPDLSAEGIPPFQYKPFHLDLFERSIDQIRPFGGCKRYSPYSFTHTLFIADQKSRTREQVLAHGLMQLFSQATAEVVQNGYSVEQDLSYPLATQGVITDGRQFTFVCFQLNTLNLCQEAGGRINMFWVGPTLGLYKKDCFNEECVRQILQLLLQRPTRRCPSLSGFTLPKPVRRAVG